MEGEGGSMADHIIKVFGYLWLGSMHNYLKYYNNNASIAGVRYEDMVSRPTETFTHLCAHLDISLSEDDHKRVLATLAQDSQKGSVIGKTKQGDMKRSTRPEDSFFKLLEEGVLKHHDVIQESVGVWEKPVEAYTLPGTLGRS